MIRRPAQCLTSSLSGEWWIVLYMMRVIRIWYVFPRTLGYVHFLIPLLVILRRKLKVIEGNHVATGMR